ncbi:MAG: hypothetical protein VX893_04305 [Candidatus Latescibacterota bacterium]|nr:hypothetical protein [Candidatus Latescibacterota bacterium]
MFTLHNLSQTYGEIIHNPGPDPNIIWAIQGVFWSGAVVKKPGQVVPIKWS